MMKGRPIRSFPALTKGKVVYIELKSGKWDPAMVDREYDPQDGQKLQAAHVCWVQPSKEFGTRSIVRDC